jgi:amino acid transporter
MSFSTLIATSAAEFNFWPSIQGNTGIHAGILYLLIPLVLVCANSLKIEVRSSFSSDGLYSNPC